jgi:hypothetical protein
VKLRLERTWCGAKCTIGQLSIDGVNECFTLEDVVRADPNPDTPHNEAKVYGETAIPAGTFELIAHKSPTFGDVPMLKDVPGYTLVYIHPGNRAENTKGCILVGVYKGPDYVADSRKAFNALFPKIKAAWARGEKVEIEVAG